MARVRGIPGDILGARKGRRSRATEGEAGTAGDPRGPGGGIGDLSSVASHIDEFERAIRESCFVDFRARVCLRANIEGDGITHNARAAVVGRDDHGLVLSKRVSNHIFPAAHAREARTVGREVKLSEDIAAPLIRASRHNPHRPAIGTTFFTSHKNALVGPETTVRIKIR